MGRHEDARIALGDTADAVPLHFGDGPCGVTAQPGATVVPSSLNLAATFDADLAEAYGTLLGTESRAAGRNVLLAPGLDIARSPWAGRLGEALGEDPLLAGTLGGRITRAVQGCGVVSVLKHYPAYQGERHRTGEGPKALRTEARDAVVDERTLHEVYLEPFRRAVSAGAGGMLCNYNRVNGEYPSQSRTLQEIPRRLWGFQGFTVPDLVFAVRDARAALEAGLDLPHLLIEAPEELAPYAPRTPAMVDAAPDATLAAIGDHVRAAIAAVGPAAPDAALDATLIGAAAHLELAERLAIESTVLLRNDGTLPLPAGARIALVGGEELASRIVMGGAASVMLSPDRMATLGHALEAVGLPVVAAADGLPSLPAPPLRAGEGVTLRCELVDSAGARAMSLDEAVLPADAADAAAPWEATLTATLPPSDARAVVAVEFAGEVELLLDGEPFGRGFRDASPLLGGPHYVLSAVLPAADRARTLTVRYRTGSAFITPTVGLEPHLSLGLVPLDDAIESAAEAAATADVAVVVVGRPTGGGMDAEDLALPAGQAELVEAVAATGTPVAVVTHGSGPIDMPWRARVAAILHTGYGGERLPEALARMLTGASEPGGRLPLTWPDGTPALAPQPWEEKERVVYAEGVDVGYRGYERTGLTPAYWFGHGLGYADTRIVEARPADGAVAAVLACGPDRGGKAVVQLYARQAPGETLKLVGFEAVRLAAGERRTVEVAVDRGALATWDGSALVPPSGQYDVRVGLSRGDLGAAIEVRLDPGA
ncbi:glycoside hydrolase family 3 C-terminal domain-containing protein [Demequina sp. SYSU T00192]|uniref:Glycoside hydrolase family 3 C-terminal domain-containing protein n=1 Tax=Demequina litoralis TaxID=3051660 RepID=A0ABT8G5N2_9MICO|nr:glycoside hydrolase family 3 C-terminal domain-containing protein [Demequina sp. SYSU T00192]MDN4474446.1 glycoside hydrolase family 3 C-terminal domain-containing protein [Demequina sp. SYSU T00192]